MDQVYLISEDTIKSETIINDNVDTCYIGPAIYTAQNMGLCELIGQKLLDKLCELVVNNDIEQQKYENYKIFLDKYVTPYLKFKVCSEITIPLAYKYRNSGIIQTNNEHEVNSQMKDAQTMKTYYDDRANFFGIKIKNYLCEHSFPESLCESNCSTGKNNGYPVNIVL